MNGKLYAVVAEVKKKNDGDAMTSITKDELKKKCFEQQNKELDKCSNSNKQYIEGNKNYQ